MKIGILTYHRSVNNGAFIQCYSLCDRLSKDFPNDTVEVIDYNSPIVEKSYSGTLSFYLFNNLKNPMQLIKRIIKLLIDPFQLHRIRKKKKVFRKSLKYLKLSNSTFFLKDSYKIRDYINSNYDVLIVGSDAIWNFISRGFPTIYLPDHTIRPFKLSYAASCYGMDFTELSKENCELIAQSLDDFSYIGVRDSATESFVRFFNNGTQCFHNCDPTCFLDLNSLPVDLNVLKKKLIKKGFDFNKPSIGLMGNQKMLKMIKSFYGDNVQIISLFNYLKDADVQLYDISPVEWAYVFRLFKFTITTYFHGTYLSLKNGVPVVCIDLGTKFGEKYKPKTFDLLERMGLEKWYFKTDYNTFGVNEIKKCCDNFLESNMSEFISKKIKNEEKYYESFYNAILRIKEIKNG